MKFLCNKEDMRMVIGLALNVITQKSYSHILSSIFIEAKDKKVMVSSTNMELSFKTHFYANIDSEGVCVVNARALNEILREIPNVEISFEAEEKNIRLLSTSKDDKFAFNLLAMSKEEFPSIPVFPSGNKITVSQKSLKDMIQKTLPVVSDEESRYSVPGVLFEIDKKTIKCVTTSTTILSFIQQDITVNEGEDASFIVPQKTLQEIVKSIGSEGNCELAYNEKQVHFHYHDIFIASSLLQKSFPNYTIIVNTHPEKQLTLKKEPLLKALKRVGILADEKLQMMKMSISDGQVEVSSENQNLGNATESIPVQYQGDALDIYFNCMYLMNVIHEVSSEDVLMEFNTALTPVKIKSTTEDHYLFVVMPMRKASQ